MTFETILLSHYSRYPSMQIQDLYKLIHQAALGSEHAIENPEGAHRWLEQEIMEMGEGLPEPVFDPISTETGMLRVHLRPYLAQGGNPNQLLNAFILTANQHARQTRLLEEYWQTAVELSVNQILPFQPAELETFFAPLKASNYPAKHHSEIYERLYRPAYRVVRKEFMD